MLIAYMTWFRSRIGLIPMTRGILDLSGKSAGLLLK